MARRAPIGAVAILFVVSGVAGLVDQVCFSKYLSYVVGSTAHAVSAVLAAFMAGLALGARLGGERAAKVARPLLAYGVLEIAVGAAVLITPFAFSALGAIYVALVHALPSSLAVLTIIRWLTAFIVVIVPTTAMGATLPLLSRLTEREPPQLRGRALGTLYAANTLGGAVGAIGSAYWFLPALGLRMTTIASGLASIGVGALAIFLDRGAPARTHSETSRDVTPHEEVGPVWTLDVVAFASGALVFACEVIFVHLLVLLVGTSAYAFGVILSIFLVCLFLGAAVAPYAHKALGSSALSLGLAMAGLSLVVSLPIWEYLPEYFKGVGGRVITFEGRELVRGVAAFAALFVPTALMGLSFPLLLQNVTRSKDVGRLVGRLTAVNTVGAVLGSLFTGYLVLPSLGSQRSLIVVALTFAAVGLATATTSGGRSVGALVVRTIAGSFAVLALFAASSAKPWDLASMTGGYHVYFDWGRGPETILFAAEDAHGGVTTVTEKDGTKTLLTNGKFQGNDGREMHAQRFFAHYPAIFVDQFDRALIVGLGTGTTLGTLADYPFKNIEVAEISPTIVEAARTYFGPGGANALDDPRVHLALEDGRNHLLLSREKYDLIGLELTSVWFAGAGSLYSREFYALANQHLREGGIFQQWIQLHHITALDLAVVIHTLRLEFSHIALFYGGGQGILVASNAPLVASRARLEALQSELERSHPDRPLKNLVDDVLVTTEGLDAFIEEVAKENGKRPSDLVSTDDNLYLEYATPRGNVLPWSSREDLVARLRQHRDVHAIEAMLTD
ncbi:MAG: fused MFS/spermidine synthase [Polyangiaceae bacterium]|nr:fused MFS/spermidine synthase [Polyangiaceae bacterium]